MNKPFEIVFISSDSDQNSFNGYLGEMPWKALPFAHRDIKGKLSSTFGVRGIPTLVLLNGDGSMLTTNGRSVCEASTFPWSGTFSAAAASSGASSYSAATDPLVVRLFLAADLNRNGQISATEIMTRMKQCGMSDSRCEKLSKILMESSSNGTTLSRAEFFGLFDSMSTGDDYEATKLYIAKAFGVDAEL